MLRFFFNRNSPVMKSFYCLGALLSILYLWQGHWQESNNTQKTLLILFWLQVLYAQALVLYPFYPKNAPGPGISLQFQKALVPISYLWPAGMILFWFFSSTAFLILFNLLLLPITTVAFILLYFYWKDPERHQVNELTGQQTTND